MDKEIILQKLNLKKARLAQASQENDGKMVQKLTMEIEILTHQHAVEELRNRIRALMNI
jgi:hypothetical protein